MPFGTRRKNDRGETAERKEDEKKTKKSKKNTKSDIGASDNLRSESSDGKITKKPKNKILAFFTLKKGRGGKRSEKESETGGSPKRRKMQTVKEIVQPSLRFAQMTIPGLNKYGKTEEEIALLLSNWPVPKPPMNKTMKDEAEPFHKGMGSPRTRSKQPEPIYHEIGSPRPDPIYDEITYSPALDVDGVPIFGDLFDGPWSKLSHSVTKDVEPEPIYSVVNKGRNKRKAVDESSHSVTKDVEPEPIYSKVNKYRSKKKVADEPIYRAVIKKISRKEGTEEPIYRAVNKKKVEKTATREPVFV